VSRRESVIAPAQGSQTWWGTARCQIVRIAHVPYRVRARLIVPRQWLSRANLPSWSPSKCIWPLVSRSPWPTEPGGGCDGGLRPLATP